MKRLVWLLLVGALIGATLYWWRHPDQQPAWVADWIPDANDVTTVMYRWQDAGGQWHIADQPPADGPYERVEVVRGTNVISGQDDGG